MSEQLGFWFDGATYDHQRDSIRLTKQWADVWLIVRDGQWHTLPELSRRTGHPEASISARLRDFRKIRFGSHEVERAYVSDGLHAYRVTANEQIDLYAEGTQP